jgi:hypothetical protein
MINLCPCPHTPPLNNPTEGGWRAQSLTVVCPLILGFNDREATHKPDSLGSTESYLFDTT